MNSPTALVRCRDASCVFGSGRTAIVALHGTSCVVEPAARIALTGSSGSGKSTLLHMMAGLERPTTGSVDWPGLDTAALAFQIGVVFQGSSLIDTLTVVENAALPAVLAGVPDADERAAVSLASVGVAHLAERFPEEISGGQAQRVAVARVLTHRPRIILADEPTGQLDRATGRQLMDVLLRAADNLGAALLVSTHDRTVADRLATQWQLGAGRLSPRLIGPRSIGPRSIGHDRVSEGNPEQGRHR